MLKENKEYIRETLRGTKKQGEFAEISFLSHLPYKMGKTVLIMSVVALFFVMLFAFMGSMGMAAGVMGIWFVATIVIIILYLEVDGTIHPGQAGYRNIDLLFTPSDKSEDFTKEVEEVL